MTVETNEVPEVEAQAVNPIAAFIPAPEACRRRAGITGHPITLSDGREWLLADGGVAPILNDIRDSLYDRSALTRSVRATDVLQAAWVLLLANYDLDDDDLAALLDGVDEAALTSAVLDAVLGPDKPRRTYTSWALASLHANGLDPAAIPAAAIPEVLEILTRTGRTIPQGDYINAAIGAAKRQGLMNMAMKLGTKP